eukprot:4079802-Amphidinium_carterae.2
MAGSARSDFEATFNGYLTTIWSQKFPPSVTGSRNLRELGVLSEALDYLLAGELGAAGDLLSQRFKAILRSVEDGGDWTVASHLEVGNKGSLSLASSAELREATKAMKYQASSHTSAKTSGKSGRGKGEGSSSAQPRSMPPPRLSAPAANRVPAQ